MHVQQLYNQRSERALHNIHFIMNFIVAYILAIHVTSGGTDEWNIYTNRFVLEIEGSKLQRILENLSVTNLSLRLLKCIVSDFYLFEKTDYPAVGDKLIYEGFHGEVEHAASTEIKFFKQERLRKRGNYLPGQDTLGLHSAKREIISENFLPTIFDVDKVWEEGYYGNNVTVAVVDCGVDMKHEDLSPNIASLTIWGIFIFFISP